MRLAGARATTAKVSKLIVSDNMFFIAPLGNSSRTLSSYGSRTDKYDTVHNVRQTAVWQKYFVGFTSCDDRPQFNSTFYFKNVLCRFALRFLVTICLEKQYISIVKFIDYLKRSTECFVSNICS